MAEITIPFNFTPRFYQERLFNSIADGYRRAISIIHRRAGKDKTLLNLLVKESFKRVGSYFYLFPTYNQGRKVLWDGMDNDGFKYLKHIPEETRAHTNNQEMKLTLKNESIIQVVGTDNVDAIMGTNPVGCVFSEYSLQNPIAWDLIQPILIANGGWAVFNYTPRGRNHGFTLWQQHRNDPDWYSELKTVVDTKQEHLAIEARKAGMLEALVQQEFYCFPPGTKVWTNKGQTEIEFIKEQDMVLTHTGRYRKVIKTYVQYHQGLMVNICSAGSCKPLICTERHPVRTCNPSTQTYEWKSAVDVKEGDYVVLPRMKDTDAPVIDSELAELIAWYITEGSVSKNHVQFSLSRKETSVAENIKLLGARFGKVHVTEVETGLLVGINSCRLADFLVEHCGSGAAVKRIPWSLIIGHDENFFLETLLDGDGCRGDYGGVESVFTTISYALALDVQMLAHMAGKRATISMRPAEKQRNVIEGRTVNISDSYSVRISSIKKTNNGRPQVLPQKHGVAALVKKVEKTQYDGHVYNLAVQFDESYVAEGRVVHNCSFEASLASCFFAGVLEGHRYVAKGEPGRLFENERRELEFRSDYKGNIELWRFPYFLSRDWDDVHWTNRYVVGTDISEGLARDWSVAYVFDRLSREFVCRMRSNTTDAHVWAHRVFALARYYENALIVPERNGAGQTTVKELLNLKANIYAGSKPNKVRGGILNQFGWNENRDNKQILCGDLRNYLAGKPYLYDNLLLEECATFVVDDNDRLGADKDFHDDCVIAAGLCLQGDQDLPKPEALSTPAEGWRERLLKGSGGSAWAA